MSLICSEGKERRDMKYSIFLNRYSAIDYEAFSCFRWLNSEEILLLMLKNRRIYSLDFPAKGNDHEIVNKHGPHHSFPKSHRLRCVPRKGCLGGHSH